MAERPGFGSYLKAALLNRWNMLLLVSGGVAAYFSPSPEIGFAALAGADLALATILASTNRLQQSVNAEFDAANAAEADENMRRRFNQIFYGLDQPSQARFNELRTRCEAMRESMRAAMDVPSKGIQEMAEAQLNGVNKLLWVYLKLLHTRSTLQKFFKQADEAEMKKQQDAVREKLNALPPEGADEITEKKRRSLQDTLATATSRMENYTRAKQNVEFVELELDRIAAKLTALTEQAVNRQDPAALSREVDYVASSVQTTEETINELHDINGITEADAAPPPILTRAPQRVRA
ncbi:MAG TPA: hypothetical protein VEK08_00330 [Planctomycetota bacterium]|nr:hypothetical protein [Planctomycetota bacterium]